MAAMTGEAAGCAAVDGQFASSPCGCLRDTCPDLVTLAVEKDRHIAGRLDLSQSAIRLDEPGIGTVPFPRDGIRPLPADL